MLSLRSFCIFWYGEKTQKLWKRRLSLSRRCNYQEIMFILVLIIQTKSLLRLDHTLMVGWKVILNFLNILAWNLCQLLCHTRSIYKYILGQDDAKFLILNIDNTFLDNITIFKDSTKFKRWFVKIFIIVGGDHKQEPLGKFHP